MLVLSRRTTEQIQIGDNVVVTVLQIHRNKVRIGITAPKTIPVVRSELKKGAAEWPNQIVPDALGFSHPLSFPSQRT